MTERDINARTKPELARAFLPYPVTPEQARETCNGLLLEVNELFEQDDPRAWELALAKVDELERIVRKVLRTAEGCQGVVTQAEINTALRSAS